MFRSGITSLLLLIAGTVQAEALPVPLTLPYAIQVAEMQSNPALQLADSKLDRVNARKEQLLSESGLNITAIAHLRAVEPSDFSINRTNNDSRAQLQAKKRLYDFGYTEARESAAQSDIESQQWLTVDARQKHLLGIIDKFNAVLVADKGYVLKNEEMTLAFLRYDKARDRHELGTVSDIDLMELENGYRVLLQERKVMEQKQRLTRKSLALALNRPDEPPSKLYEPEVVWEKELPSLDAVLEKALSSNPSLQAAREALNSANRKLEAAQAKDNPVLHGEMSVADYHRETGSTHKAIAGLILEIPLYTGGKNTSDVALARASLREAQANLRLIELAVRESVMELVLRLETLKADMQAQQVSEEYGELYMDKNRALYELEVASDFGDAVVRVSKVILKKLQTKLDFLATEAQLAALQGQAVTDIFTTVDNGKTK
ncbi:MAG: TolC family protein [Gammaproteobacteria bacterium]|nr:TolC family protein [Gammaproteobacteria bacterium]NNJ92605.1 TolC family protein [Gammaproteobacteria bacterium]